MGFQDFAAIATCFQPHLNDELFQKWNASEGEITSKDREPSPVLARHQSSALAANHL